MTRFHPTYAGLAVILLSMASSTSDAQEVANRSGLRISERVFFMDPGPPVRQSQPFYGSYYSFRQEPVIYVPYFGFPGHRNFRSSLYGDYGSPYQLRYPSDHRRFDSRRPRFDWF